MSHSRRAFIERAASLCLVTAWSPRAAFASDRGFVDDPALTSALMGSDLVYLCPLLGSHPADERESRCHAEVWFVYVDEEVLVVTAASAWRARAIRAGHRHARMWVGDHGVWTEGDAWRSAPVVRVQGAQLDAPEDHARALDAFGDKYALSWLVWGPRFRNGLADGSRVLLRYRVA